MGKERNAGIEGKDETEVRSQCQWKFENIDQSEFIVIMLCLQRQKNTNQPTYNVSKRMCYFSEHKRSWIQTDNTLFTKIYPHYMLRFQLGSVQNRADTQETPITGGDSSMKHTSVEVKEEVEESKALISSSLQKKSENQRASFWKYLKKKRRQKTQKRIKRR